MVCEPSSPALENLIHGVFIVADLLVSDKTARTAEQLTRGLAGSAFDKQAESILEKVSRGRVAFQTVNQ